jgi:AhpD family alkylhydroperoxidase
MSILEQAESEGCVLPRQPLPDELRRAARRTFGFVPEYLDYFSACPWVVRATMTLEIPHMRLLHTRLDLAEMIALVVSQDNSCRYCYATHRMFLKIAGFREDDIQRLEHEFLTSQFGPDRKVPLDFARRVSRADPPPSATECAALVAGGCDPQGLKEIAYVTALFVFLNRLLTLPAIPYEPAEGLERAWRVRWTAPVWRWWFGRLVQPTVSEPRPAGSSDGPFSEIARAFDGLSIAAALRTTLEEAWSTGPLSRRAKGLVFAVVARAVGSRATEREATRLLAAEGIDQAAVEHILAHLGSPELDGTEALIVPYARDTVRYDPAQIQRRGKVLREALSNEQFIDLVGTASLANAVARLGATFVDQAS